jgi:hypothetical protein
LREILTEKPISHILDTGLHHYLDVVQIHIQNLAGAIGRAFFRDWRPAAPGSDEATALSHLEIQPAAQTQSQSQGSVAAVKPPASAGGTAGALA